MDLKLKCCLLPLLLLLACAASALATPTLDKSKGSLIQLQKPAYLQNPAQLLSQLSSKFVKPKPVFVKPVVVKPIVVVKPVVVGGGGGGGGGHGHGHGHGHHGKNKFFGKFI